MRGVSRLRDVTPDMPPDPPLAVFRAMTIDLTMAIRDMSMTCGLPAAPDLAKRPGCARGSRCREGGAVRLSGGPDHTMRPHRSYSPASSTSIVTRSPGASPSKPSSM